MCLTLGVTILASPEEIQRVMSYKCNVGKSVWSAKASRYLHIALVFQKYLYMHLIYP